MAITNAAATAYSNQKKLVTLSTGRKVMLYAETTSNGKLKYSDDGVTWTDYAADIAGLANGSITAYVDDNGAEYLAVVWRQSGTGGSRSDQFCYAMVGVFDDPRTAITWGSAAHVQGDTTRNYPDLVAHAEPGGGRLHIVTSRATDGSVWYKRVPVWGTTIGNPETNGGISAAYSTTVDTFPSIDYDPDTKQLFVAWSAGTTGAGKGIRFKTASYSQGSWTWGSEVEVSTGHYIQSEIYYVICRWDGTRVVLAGNLYTGSSANRAAWESTNFTSFTNLFDSSVSETSQMRYGSVAIDQGTGDIYLLGTGALLNWVRYLRWDRASETFDSGVVTDSGTVVTPYVNAAYNNGRIEWIYVWGNNSPYAVKYDYLAVNAAPAVELVTPADEFEADLTADDQEFSWTIDDAEGDAQSKYVFRRRKPEHNTYEYWDGDSWTSTLTEVTSTDNDVTIPADTWDGSASWYWSVGVRDDSAASPIGYSKERLITNTGFATEVNTYVGSFVKSTTTGNQDITIPVDLTTAPAGSWAVIFWAGMPLASGSWGGHAFTGLGFAANGGGTISQYSVASIAEDAQSASNTARAMSAYSLTILGNASLTVDATADFIGFPTSTTMRVNWNNRINAVYDSTQCVVNYMIITGLSGAKVVNWTEPGSATAKSVAGVGFSPDLVLHAGSPDTSLISSTDANMGFGAMNKHGQQWANTFLSMDATDPANTSRWQQTDACFVLGNASEATMTQAHFSSMDSDGFTMNFSISDLARMHFSLCIKGVSSKLGAFTVTNTASQTITTRHGFTPKGWMFANNGALPSENASPKTQSIFALGAYDGTNQRHAQLYDLDAAGSAGSPTTTKAKSVWRNDASIALNNTSIEYSIGSVSSSDTAGLTVNWTTPSVDGREVLYLAVGDPETNTTPATIGTSTSSTATAYSNQKKLVRLSTGRMVAVFGDTSTNAKFKYSDDGITWTDYSADIAGWADGSIDSYVDAGGTERIVAVWKQSGTAGGRTDAFNYAMAGTFNTDRATLAWGAALLVGGSSNHNHHDLVAHAEGSGGYAHIVRSQTNLGRVHYYGARITGDSVATDVSQTLIGGPYGAVNSFPSIDYDPATKRLFIAWSAGSTGSGNGIRFCTASYGGGSWTLESEVEVDNTETLDSGTNRTGVICRWYDAAKEIVIGVQTCANPIFGIRMYRSTNFTSFSNKLIQAELDYTTNPALFAGTMIVDQGNGDIYFLGNSYSFSGDHHYYKWTRSSDTVSGPTVLYTSPSIFGYYAGNYHQGRIEFIGTYGNNSPYAVRYDYISTGAPTVTLTSPEPGARIDLTNNSQQFAWSISDAEGNAQTHYIFRRRRDGHTGYEYWNAAGSAWTTTYTEVSSSTINVTIAAGKWRAGKNYYWSVGVKDDSGAIGYSEERKITNSAAEVNTYVGSFTTQSGTGNQDITIAPDLASAPAGSWAIMFWMHRVQTSSSGTWGPHAYPMVGYAASGGGSISQYSISATMLDNVGTTTTDRRMAAKSITAVDNGTTMLEGELSSFPTATTMRINWGVNAGWNATINYMIITGLSGAKVVNWQFPGVVTNTDKSVNGVGFSPDLVLHASYNTAAAVPSSSTTASYQFGIMNKHGQQWGNSIHSQDGVNPSNTSSWQQTDAFLAVTGSSEAQNSQAHFKSMDSDGFTVHFSNSTGSAQIISLCIVGVSSKLGAFTTSGTDIEQTITTNHGFEPKGLLTASIGYLPLSAPIDTAAWDMGATDFTNQRSAALYDYDAVSPTDAQSIWSSQYAMTWFYSPTGPEARHGAIIDADTDSFTVEYDEVVGVNYERPYLIIGDADDDTFPVTIGTSTSATATAYSNQKKLVRLSTGRLVAVYGDTGTNAKFKYSDDGITWVDYQADIAGWANGSIASYVDAGGIERIVAAWIQSGTGGGRTSNDGYAMCGTFNTARTAITWGTAVNITGTGTTRWGYPDIVCLAEGTGGKVFVPVSDFNAGPGRVPMETLTVSSSGVLTYNSGVFMDGGTAANAHTYPSIDYNPTTKDLYLAWSGGGTGSGKGIRFKKATYSNGSWTWGTEREIDTTHYADGAGCWLNCRFDGTRVLIGGELATASGSDIVLYERDVSDTTTTTRLLVTGVSGSTRAASTSITYDQDGNVYILGIGGGTGSQPNYRIWNRSTQTTSSQYFLESWFTGQSICAARGYYGDKIDFIYTYGNNSPYAVKYDYINTTAGDDNGGKLNQWGIIPI